MSLLVGTQLAKSFGADDIFAGVNVSLPHGARVALVGPNGAGKTTLLRLLAGLEAPSRGTVQVAKGARIGYLPQEAKFDSERTVWDEMLTAFTELRALEKELARLEALMADQAARGEVMEKYGALQHQFELEGGYAYETRIRQVLDGLNFAPEEYHKPLNILSGGQKTRALLGRLLLESPDLLILDEPTNHLDIHAVEWLETWINHWTGAVLLVSHDRYFMDRVAQAIWSLEFGTLTEYRGHYSAYQLQHEERRARQLAEYEAQQAFLAKEMDFIRRNLAGQNTRQAKGRLRRLERITRDDPESQRAVKPQELDRIKLRMTASLRSGDRVIETQDLVVGYVDDGGAPRVLFRVPDLLLWRGECAALVGPNGSGKSTFLKTLLGQLKPLAGEARLGSSLKVGYFAQAAEREDLRPEGTVLEEVLAAQPEQMSPGKARDYLGRFLFSGDDVFKPVAVLSGGERGRLALATLALSGANLLLLDEPTNHLDIPSQEILESVLSDFDGTILLVSHDRYLIDDLATQVWSVDTERGMLEVFAGSWSEYVEWREKEKEKAREGEKENPNVRASVPTPKGRRVATEASNAERRLSHNEQRKRAAKIAELEDLITALERRRADITRELEQTNLDVQRARALGEDYAQTEAELAARLDEWESLAA
jgi:ATP-binding cassette subfamily F protein 3